MKQKLTTPCKSVLNIISPNLVGIERTEVQTLTVLNSPSLKRSQGSRLQMNTIVKSGILDRRFCFHEGSPIPDPPELTPYLSRRGRTRGELLHAN